MIQEAVEGHGGSEGGAPLLQRGGRAGDAPHWVKIKRKVRSSDHDKLCCCNVSISCDRVQAFKLNVLYVLMCALAFKLK